MSATQRDNIVKHSLLLIVFANAANATNLIFQAIMGRELPKAEFTDMQTMLTMLLVLITPLDAVRTSFAHAAAVGVQADRPWAARDLLAQWGRIFFLLASAFILVGMLVSPMIAGFFHLHSVWSARTAIVIFSLSLFSPLLVGVYQGVQSFVWMSAAQAGWSIIRLACGIVLVYFVSAVAPAALLSHAIGISVGMAASTLGLVHLARRPANEPAQHHPLGGYFVQSVFMLSGYALMQNADVMLVKHFFAAADADKYTQAATIGRAVVFMPIPIAMAMFPKVVSVGSTSRQSLMTLLKALGIGMGIVGALILICSAVTWLPLLILFKIRNPDPEQCAFIRHVLWAMSPTTITYLLMNFEMAQHRFRALPFLLLCVAGYIGGVALFHGSLSQFVAILATASTASALCFIALVIRAHMRHA